MVAGPFHGRGPGGYAVLWASDDQTGDTLNAHVAATFPSERFAGATRHGSLWRNCEENTPRPVDFGILPIPGRSYPSANSRSSFCARGLVRLAAKTKSADFRRTSPTIGIGLHDVEYCAERSDRVSPDRNA